MAASTCGGAELGSTGADVEDIAEERREELAAVGELALRDLARDELLETFDEASDEVDSFPRDATEETLDTSDEAALDAGTEDGLLDADETMEVALEATEDAAELTLDTEGTEESAPPVSTAG